VALSAVVADFAVGSPVGTVSGLPRLCLARAWIALDMLQLQEAGRWITAAVDAATRAIHLGLGDSRPGRSAAYCIYGAT